MRGDLFGHFVAFQHVLESANLETHFIGDANQHQDFVGTVAVGMHVAFALHHFH